MHITSSAGLGGRLERVRARLAEAGLDALVVVHRPNVFYLTNFRSSSSVVVVTDRRVYLLADSRYTTALDTLLASPGAPPGAEAVPVGGSGAYDDVLVAWLGEHARGWAVGFEASHLSVRRHDWLRARLVAGDGAGESAAVRWLPTNDLVEGCRETKDDHEVAIFREAARRLSAVARRVVSPGPRAGTSERELAAEIDHRMRLAGFDRPAFETIVASGPNSALPHAEPGDRVLAPGDLVVLDFGGVYAGYCVDLTRTVTVGEPSAEARRLYRAVAEAQDAAMAALRPDVPGEVVDAAARDVLAGHGLGEAFGHGTGHGLGLEIHEAPRIARPRDDADGPLLRPGMVVTIEPGAYLPGFGGVRLEDDLLVTADGAVRLTDVPRDERLL